MEENINAQETSNDASSGQLVVFGLGEEEFGVDIHAVREIVRLPEITPVPKSPEYANGICNLRGSVLPVIDTRCRFNMDMVDPTEDTRMLVVESQGIATGIIVDDMREVLRLHGTSIEDTPGVCRGVDDEFLSGVVSLDNGKRLIMALNLEQIINIEINSESSGATAGGGREDAVKDDDLSEEEQLVSFQAGPEEYALDINAVREILRVSEITEVPNVPEYVKGLFTIRKNLMPVVDLRSLLGMDSIVSQKFKQIESMQAGHERWVAELKAALDGGGRFAGEIDPGRSALGIWINEFNTASQEIQNGIKGLREPHGQMHGMARTLIERASSSKDEALAGFENQLVPLAATVLGHLDALKELIDQNIHEDQRILVVDDGELTVGYLVDHVNEVLRVPKSIINEPPSIAATEKNEIRGVAKLDDGKRLILIMDQETILSGSDSEILDDIAAKNETADKGEKEGDEIVDEDDDQKTLAEQSLEEEQLVTFILDKEEYGIRIMQVQEINRLEEITEVPKAPAFIDGVTNLRGNIIPVLNIRTLFGMTAREADDKSRIIIVDIGGNKTGILVDQVNEVMRLSKNDIDQTPAIVSGAGNKFMDGICKLNGGERMVTMLNVEQLLTSDELGQFSAMGDKKKSARKAASKTATTKRTPARKKPAAKKKLKIAE